MALGSSPDPAGELTALPQTILLDLRNLLLRGGRRRNGEEKGKGGKERKGGRREWERNQFPRPRVTGLKPWPLNYWYNCVIDGNVFSLSIV